MRYFFFLLMFAFVMNGQDKNESTATFFDDSNPVEYSASDILITGEVEQEQTIKLSSLPLRSFPYKEVLRKDNDKKRFIGSYYVSGYSLYDIIANVKLKKTNEEEFRPLVDLYIIVENDKGDKTIFSWGELFYTKDNHKSIIAKSITPINPSKGKMEWPVAENSRLICSYDLTNERFIENPTKITIKSAPGEYSKERVENTYSPEMEIIYDGKTHPIGKLDYECKHRSFEHIGYGHGRGFKSIENKDGILLKDVLLHTLLFDSEIIKTGLVILSAKDGYRVTYSLSEIINRNDLEDCLLFDCGNKSDAGKYTSFMIADFFVDRNVKSIEKLEIIKP